jgi:SAM-dependent methyltransferase
MSETRPIFCLICGNPSHLFITKKNTDYYTCESCNTIFSAPLDQESMVGGMHEEGRALQNPIRLDRIKTMTEGIKKEDIRILDFGCGNFLLGKYLQNKGYNVTGYDAYSEEYSCLPEKNKYHLCLMIEVIEHTSSPFIELEVIHRSLKDGGLLYVETGFYDVMIEDNVKPEDYVYIEPSVGHSTIFSHHSLDLLMAYRGFRTRRHFDRNCRLYEKVKK